MCSENQCVIYVYSTNHTVQLLALRRFYWECFCLVLGARYYLCLIAAHTRVHKQTWMFICIEKNIEVCGQCQKNIEVCGQCSASE